jgi:hypothetical protein
VSPDRAPALGPEGASVVAAKRVHQNAKQIFDVFVTGTAGSGMQRMGGSTAASCAPGNVGGGAGREAGTMSLGQFVGFAADVKLLDGRLTEQQLAEVFARATVKSECIGGGGGASGEMDEAAFEHALTQISERKGIGIMPLLGMLMSKAFSLQHSQANESMATAQAVAEPGPGSPAGLH